MKDYEYENEGFAVPKRPKRRHTNYIVLHRITVGEGVKGIVDFFTTDPEGVATCTVGGFEKRLDAIRDWRKNGVPDWAKKKAYVPYNFLVGRNGKVHKMLAYEARGAHAAPYNNCSIGIGIVGDFRKEAPTDAQVLGVKKLCRYLMRKYKNSMEENPILTHDEVRAKDRKKPKYCPGKFFPADEVRTWVYRADEIMDMQKKERF